MINFASNNPFPLMSRIIRKAISPDLDAILDVLESGRQIMVSSGNPNQWAPGYPSAEMVLLDIEKEAGFVMEEEGRIVGYFAYLPSPEPTYEVIYGGQWLDDTRPYHVVHRIAKRPDVHGIFEDMLAFCAASEKNLRIDTHVDNKIMQHNLTKNGFTYCGIILLTSGDERLAYQRIEK